MLPVGAISQFNPLKDEELTEINENEIMAKEMADAFKITFTTPHGAKVLNWMVEMFLSRPVARPGDDQLTVGIRQGRSDLVMQILNQMKKSDELGD